MAGHTKFIIAIVLIVVASISCTNDTNRFIPIPVAEQTTSLEAAYTNKAPSSLNDSYWQSADYVVIPVEEIISGQVSDSPGLLNVNGMYNGIEDFNQGNDAALILKAAYDDVNLYILASWQDNRYNASQENWLFNGPEDPLKKTEDRFGWTSQQNDDNLILSFENTSGQRDVWKWSLALSDPMGYALDMHGADPDWNPDSGKPSYERNVKDVNDVRSGPKFQWNGQDQEVNKNPGGSTLLDPGYFLSKTTEFNGDINRGETIYQVTCGICHGKGGDGNGAFQNSQVPLNVPGWLNRYTQLQLDNVLGNETTHRGARYWNGLNAEEQVDLGARLKAFAGVPGYILQQPNGSSADIIAVSNVLLSRIDSESENAGYQLLLIRKLNTGNDDDIAFVPTPGSVYNFNVYLTDNDNLNLVGSIDHQLKFVK